MPALRALAITCVVALVPATAEAYRTAADLPEHAGTARVRWPAATYSYAVSEQGLEHVALRFDPEAAVRRAVATWSTVDCARVTGVFTGRVAEGAVSGDGVVTVQWIGDEWASRGFAADAAATTEVVYAREDGGDWVITDADIYLNAVGFTWGDAGTDETVRDIQAVVTHELGHVLGLLHPCERGGFDGAPDCASGEYVATMRPEYAGIAQRVLEEDDRQGLCFLYPRDECASGSCPEQPEPCADASCVGTLELGDPCATASDCGSGFCSSGGYCTFACRADGSCGDDAVCDPTAGAVPECAPTRAIFGESCATASDCVSDLCLDGTSFEPFCTRGCAPDRSCPKGFSCSDVSGRDVCRPPPPSGGCTVVVGRRDEGTLATIGALIAIALLSRTVRRPRK